MSVCQIEERDAGRPYPRTCPTCGLGKSCAKGLNRKSQADRIAELEAENERLRKDAERYRALRDGSLDDLAVVRGLGVIDYGLNVRLYTYLKEIEGDEMDNAIDAARRALEGGE